MAQFDVHRLADGALVVDVQSDLISHLQSRLVVPLIDQAEVSVTAPRLNPTIQILDKKRVLAPQFAATLFARSLGPAITSVNQHDYAIQAALDVLIYGI